MNQMYHISSNSRSGDASTARALRIGMIGAGWMGRAHTMAFQTASSIFRGSYEFPELVAIADACEEIAAAAAKELGYRKAYGDWRGLVGDSEVNLIAITTPNYLHAEIAEAAAKAGKHVYCEKPLATSPDAAKSAWQAAQRSQVVNLVGYNNIKHPAQAYAKELIESGEIGEIVRFSGTFDQDVLLDPDAAFTWRHDRSIAGPGALGDLGTHLISLAQKLVGDFASVSAITRTVVKQRPDPRTPGQMRSVENDDVALFNTVFANGAIGSLGTSRMAAGRKHALKYEIQGTKGAIAYDQEQMNEIRVFRTTGNSRDRGFAVVPVGPDHKGYSAFYPNAGVGIGYADLKTIEVDELFRAVTTGSPVEADFEFGYKIDCVVDAVLRSAAQKQWISL
ncbi:MAG TPA: Gfo/Idh/MocA family oxidoreductase [Chthoniobacterales bacterium]|nr:Gfo/Idh/MocA family oxidoreductase [Chthoniobacterales bacterium]